MGAKEKKEVIKALMNCRSKKLRHRINQLLKLLNFFGRDLRVQQAVDQAYYIQKQQELELLEEKLSYNLNEALKYFNRLEQCYNQTSMQWKTDAKNLNRILGRTVYYKRIHEHSSLEQSPEESGTSEQETKVNLTSATGTSNL